MRTHIALLLLCSLLLCTLLFPVRADSPPALMLTQTDTAEPGQDVTLTLSLPATALAGGFVTLAYDASLFLLKSVTLLQATDALTLTYHDARGNVNILIDAAQNVQIEGALLSLTFASSEEAQPGSYAVTCTVPDAASFYALDDDGSTTPLGVNGCQGTLTLTDPPLPPCPARYLACQETNAVNDQFTVRLCALVEPDATLSRGSYGFILAVTDSDGTRELTLGGSQITDRIEGGGKIYTADALGGQIYTASLSLCAAGEVRITLTPYVHTDGLTLYAGTYTITYVNGTYVSTSGGN